MRKHFIKKISKFNNFFEKRDFCLTFFLFSPLILNIRKRFLIFSGTDFGLEGGKLLFFCAKVPFSVVAYALTGSLFVG